MPRVSVGIWCVVCLGLSGCAGASPEAEATPAGPTSGQEAAERGPAPSEGALPPRDDAAHEALRGAHELHLTAQRKRQDCMVDPGGQGCDTVDADFVRAAGLYERARREHESLRRDPEVRRFQVDCLFYGRAFAEAASEARALVQTLEPNEANHGVRAEVAEVEVYALDALLREQGVQLPAAPPNPEGSPPRVTPMSLPHTVQLLVAAQDRAADIDPDAASAPRFALAAALAMWAYGHYDDARQRFTRIFETYCTEHAGIAQEAAQRLADMARAVEDRGQAERWLRTVRQGACPDGTGAEPVD